MRCSIFIIIYFEPERPVSVRLRGISVLIQVMATDGLYIIFQFSEVRGFSKLFLWQINSFEDACIDLLFQKPSQTSEGVFDVAILSLLTESVEKTTQYFPPIEFHSAWFWVQIMTLQSPIIRELLDHLKHSRQGRFSSSVSRAEFGPKLSTYPQVIWRCPNHKRGASLLKDTIITDSFLWAEICQKLDPRLWILEDCSHSNHRYSRPAEVLGSTDLKFDNFTTTALATLRWGHVAHQLGLFSLVYLTSRTHCFSLRDVPASSPLTVENREFFFQIPSSSGVCVTANRTVTGLTVCAVSWTITH
jgi:hypothetical protein